MNAEIIGISSVLGISYQISLGMEEVEIDLQSANSELVGTMQQPIAGA